ncbi:MAG: hypothetical protein ABR497_04230 [Kiritimatiellia bacterium]|nr:hypothetical protein [Lentisphaerota bacterium]
MKQQHILLAGCVLVFTAGVLLLGTGCEVSSADARIEITPSSSVLHHSGQSVTLTAQGGYRYEWSVENREIGYLNTHSGNQVVYTSIHVPTEVAAVQVVQVLSRYSDNTHADAGGATTNAPTTGAVHFAEAYITHYPEPAAPVE